MLNNKNITVLNIIFSLTGEDDTFKIIEADEILEVLPSDMNLSKLDLSVIIKELKDMEFLKVKYFTPDEYCLSLTYKFFDYNSKIIAEKEKELLELKEAELAASIVQEDAPIQHKKIIKKSAAAQKEQIKNVDTNVQSDQIPISRSAPVRSYDRKEKKWKKNFGIAFSAFLGAFLGGAMVVAISELVKHFIL